MPISGVPIAAAVMYAVPTHAKLSNALNSPAMVGSAVEMIEISIEASSTASISAPSTDPQSGVRHPRDGRDVPHRRKRRCTLQDRDESAAGTRLALPPPVGRRLLERLPVSRCPGAIRSTRRPRPRLRCGSSSGRVPASARQGSVVSMRYTRIDSSGLPGKMSTSRPPVPPPAATGGLHTPNEGPISVDGSRKRPDVSAAPTGL